MKPLFLMKSPRAAGFLLDVKADAKSKLMEHDAVTDASVPDSPVLLPL